MPTVGPDSLDKSSELKLSHGRALTMICARGESFAHSTHTLAHTQICICCQGQTHTLVGKAEGKGNRKGYGQVRRFCTGNIVDSCGILSYGGVPGACSVIARHLSHGIKERRHTHTHTQLERQLRECRSCRAKEEPRLKNPAPTREPAKNPWSVSLCLEESSLLADCVEPIIGFHLWLLNMI